VRGCEGGMGKGAEGEGRTEEHLVGLEGGGERKRLEERNTEDV